MTKFTKEQIRAVVPDIAGFVDDIREAFGPVKVTALKVDALGLEMGEFTTPAEPYQEADTKPPAVYQAEWKAQVDKVLAERDRMKGRKGRRR